MSFFSKLPRLRTLLLIPVVLFVLVYIAGVITLMSHDEPVVVMQESPAHHATVAIFGASGTAGDGILKAAMADSAIEKIHVITRRTTPRMEEGVASGKVIVTLHTDYLDYSAVHEQVAEVDAVYWAIGISSVGVDEETYGMIHVDFPVRFVEEWTDISDKPDISFHYISSSDISEDSRAMWAREKVRAEKTLFAFADETKLRVIAYRPDYIGPTSEEAHLQAMIEVTARGAQFENGDYLGTWNIRRYSDAYEERH
jgi:nucleoside-diphosphate-sugar epimerase